MNDRLRACGLDLSTSGLMPVQTQHLAANNPANVLCVRQFNNIIWEEIPKPGADISFDLSDNYILANLSNPADTVQTDLIDSHPVAVRTNIIDALTAYVKA